MSIYISKNAINNVPVAEENLTDSKEGDKLQNEPLKNSRYLKGLARNDAAYKKLELNSSGQHIIYIKMALEAIDKIYDDYTIVDKLNQNSDLFDNALKSAVEKFQLLVPSLNPDGIINSQTLLAIDKKLSPQDIFNYEKNKYEGKLEGSINVELIAKSGGGTSFDIIIGGGDRVHIESDINLDGEIVYVKPEFQDNNDYVTFSPSIASLEEIKKNPAIKAINEKRITEGLPELKSVEIAKSDFNIKLSNITLPFTGTNSDSANIPPLLFNDKDAKLYQIQAGDKISKIVLDNYYGGGGFPIKNPYDNSIIFTLPERTPFPKEKRSEDARFQFYLNLIYYYNSDETSSGLKEYGVTKANGYQRYPVDHLDNVNIFDNEFDPADPQTGLPNYYRFLKRMETLNPQSKIQFDSDGNATSFDTIEGKNIRIPSRKFADSMFYFLNFRQNEMLVPVIIPPIFPATEPTSIMEYVADEVLDTIIDTISDTIDDITSLAVEVKNDAIDLYYEAADFFSEAYNFAISALTENWPRGLGGTIAADANVTWGIPINTSGGIERSIYRKMSKNDELTIVYTNQFTLGASLDEYQGYSYSLGYATGNGKSNKAYGIDVGLSASVGLKTTVVTEYEFPVRKDETTLLTMIIAVFGGSIVTSIADVLTFFKVMNLDPRQYITKMEVGLEENADAAILAKTSLTPTGNTQSDEDQAATNNFASVDNIFSKIPGLGANASFTGGVGFTCEIVYDGMPRTKNFENRIFKKIEIDTNVYLEGKLDVGLKLGFFKRLFLDLTPVGTFFNTIFGALSFDNGLMLGVHYTLIRKSGPDEIVAGDFDFTEIDFTSLSNGSIKYKTNTNNVDKEISLYLGYYTGDVDTLCEPGTEVKYHLDLGVLYEMWQQKSNYDYSFDNVFKLFKEIEYHKKVGFFSWDKSDSKKLVINDNSLTDKITTAYETGNQNNREVSITTAVLKNSLEKVKADNFFISAGVALDMKMKIKLNELKEIFEFYLKKLYLKYVLLQPDISGTARKLVETNVEKYKNRIVEAIKKIPRSPGELEIQGTEYFDYLYGKKIIPNSTIIGLVQYMTNEVELELQNHTNPKSYLEIINKFVEGVRINNFYLDGITTDDIDYGMTQIIQAFSFLAELGNLEATLEIKLGGKFGGSLKGGADLLTAGVGLNALAEGNYQAKLYEDGVLTDLYTTDILHAVYQKIQAALGKKGSNNRIGAKTVFEVLQK